MQRRCACGGTPGPTGECESCRKKAQSLQRQTRNSELETRESSFAPPIVHEVLRSLGQPLDATTRAFMESRLGHDFSGVRVHSNERAAESARAVDALAYTVGRNMVFGTSQYAPATSEGRRLLAHELTHTIQQQGTAQTAFDSLSISSPSEPSEHEAEQSADAFATGDTVRIGAAPGAAMQRQPMPDSKSAAASDALIENASPFLAAALGSVTLERFDTGKSDLKTEHKTQLASVAHSIQVLLRKYSLSTVTIVGHADTVGTEANNLRLGQDRADVVKQTLSDLGVSDSIISAESKGEAAPQAVKTKDEVPSARNRRVDVRFHPKASNLGLMTPQLKLPSAGDKPADEFSPVEKPPIDLNYHPRIEPPDPTKLPADFWKPIPPAPKGSGPKSPLDVVGEKFLDPVIDAVAGSLPKNLRDKIKEGARDAVTSGLSKGARAAAEAAGLKDPKGLDAIEKAAEAAIQEKGKSPR